MVQCPARDARRRLERRKVRRRYGQIGMILVPVTRVGDHRLDKCCSRTGMLSGAGADASRPASMPSMGHIAPGCHGGFPHRLPYRNRAIVA